MTDHILEDRLAEAKAILCSLADAKNLEALPPGTICRTLTGVIALLEQAEAAIPGPGRNWDAIEAHLVMDEVAGAVRGALADLETYKRDFAPPQFRADCPGERIRGPV